MHTPRVLITAMGRINAADTANNGLLLRNLFGRWPKERLAQIYSGGDNDDSGFFGRYYSLSAEDRRLGRLFFPLKRGHKAGGTYQTPGASAPASGAAAFAKRLLVYSGAYELLFSPRISRRMADWVADFQPDIIFSQGYSLTFARLPVMLAERFGLPLAYYPSDDWPNENYRIKNRVPIVSDVMARRIQSVSRRLVAAATVRLAFNPYMQAEYAQRYKAPFDVLMHGDDALRFDSVAPLEHSSNGHLVVSTGIFNDSRLPLLEDLDKACGILHQKGWPVRAKIYPVNQRAEFMAGTNCFQHLTFLPCPSHDGLVPVLKGADILFLPERFDESASGIATSVSSKAHLFMFSGRPIVVYSDPVTGIARYAREKGWATAVSRRDSAALAAAMENILTDESARRQLVDQSRRIAMENHHLPVIQAAFERLMYNAVWNQKRYAS